jgi:SRSO17 transposase
MPMLTYAPPLGHAFIDRRLYLPASWCKDPVRLAEAGVPADVAFATKPHLVVEMLASAIAAGVMFSYFTADSGYGRDPGRRDFCHDQGVAYVMAVPVDLPLIASRGNATRPDLVASRLQAADFERRSCGHATLGERYHDWAAVAVTVKEQAPADGKEHTLLVRRSVSAPSQIEYLLAHARRGAPVGELIGVAGMRWKIEENNEHGKDLLGLDQYQVRKWVPWHRHVTTCMLAAAFLAVTCTDLPTALRTDLGKDLQPQEQAVTTAG